MPFFWDDISTNWYFHTIGQFDNEQLFANENTMNLTSGHFELYICES